MVPATLPQTDAQLKTPNDELDRPSEVESLSREGSIVIRMGLDGIQTVQIIANQSDEDDQLRERLTAARPVLELLQAVVRAER